MVVREGNGCQGNTISTVDASQTDIKGKTIPNVASELLPPPFLHSNCRLDQGKRRFPGTGGAKRTTTSPLESEHPLITKMQQTDILDDVSNFFVVFGTSVGWFFQH